MRFHVRCHIFLGLFFFLQLSQGGEKTQEELTLFIQKNVEHLIEKILSQMQEYYREIKSKAKCIPDYLPDSVIETLKKSIDCVFENERNYADGKIKSRMLTKNFLTCFSEAKKEVNDIMIALDPYEDYCPENMTEKTYQINLTTIFTKTFRINIKNGLEVMHKEIDFSKDNYLDHALDAVYNSNGSENNEDEHDDDDDDDDDDGDDYDDGDGDGEDDDDGDGDNDDDDDDDDDGDGDGDDDDGENEHSDGDEDENEHGENDDQENDQENFDDHGDKETSRSSLDNVHKSDKPSGHDSKSDINERKLGVNISIVQPSEEKISRNNSDKYRKGKKTISPNVRNKNQASDIHKE